MPETKTTEKKTIDPPENQTGSGGGTLTLEPEESNSPTIDPPENQTGTGGT